MYLSPKHLSFFSPLNPYKHFCIHNFLQQDITSLCYPVPSLLLCTYLHCSLWFHLLDFLEKTIYPCPAFLCLMILHTCYILPKSLQTPEIFCLPVVPHREATLFFFTVLTFFLSLFPLLKVFDFLITDDFQAKAFSHSHTILLYLCSTR